MSILKNVFAIQSRRNFLLPVLAACVIFCMSNGCKQGTTNPVAPSTNGTVGASGGTVYSPDSSVVMVIPAGALTTDTKIVITTIVDTTCPQHVGITYNFEPNGQTFSKPVSVTLPYASADLTTDPKFLGVAYKESGSWYGVTGGSVDTSKHTVTASISHFSEWSEYESIRIDLDHREGWTLVGKQSAVSMVVLMDGAPLNAPPANPLILPVPTPVQAIWTVNGVSNGDATNGTITTHASGNNIMDYNAPAHMPPSNPVAIAATVSVANLGSVSVIVNEWVLAKSWRIDLDRTFGAQCQANNTMYYHYDYDSPSWVTFDLGSDGVVTNVNPMPGLSTITNVGPCLSAPGVSYDVGVTQGKPEAINSLSGSFSSRTGLMLTVGFHDLDIPGVTVVMVSGASSVTVLDLAVIPGNDDVNPPIQYPVRDVSTRVYSNKDQGLPEYTGTTWKMSAVY